MESLEILKYVVILIHILFTCLTVSVVIFLSFEWKNSKSIFRSSYFVILNVGYFEDVIFSICNIYGHLINYDSKNLLLPLILFVQWHSYNILGFWEAVLGFNRCTALGFPMAHRKIWSKLTTGLFILAIIAFPFIADWFSFTNTLCKIFSKPECPEYLSFTNTNTAYINISLSIISTPLILFGIYKSPKSQTPKANIERRLIIQTLFSSASITALFSITLFAAFIQISYEKASVFGYIIYIIQFYPSIFILFYVSPVFRKNFIQFYKLSYIFGGKSKTKIGNVIVIG